MRVRHSAKRDEVIPSPSSKVPGLGCWSERKCGVLRNELFRRKIFVRSTLRGRGQDEVGHEIRSKEAFMRGGERLFRRGPQVNVLRYSHSATACLSSCRLGCNLASQRIVLAVWGCNAIMTMLHPESECKGTVTATGGCSCAARGCWGRGGRTHRN